MSILNKYKRWIPQLLLVKDRYLDFVLSQYQGPSEYCHEGKLKTECLISFIDFNNPECIISEGNSNNVISDKRYIWENAENSGETLYNIGFTGTDNGLIVFDKEEITNEKFLNILTGSTYDLSDSGKQLKMFPVSGNTKNYLYPCELINSEDDGWFYSFKGGFLQGFYKIFGHEYQVLPNSVDKCWHLEFVLRPKDYEIENRTLNKTHKGTDGIFFYMGTRSENKFAKYYNSDIDKFPSRFNKPEDCSGEYFKFDWDFSKKEIVKRNETKLQLLSFLFGRFSNYSNCECLERKKEEKREEEPIEYCDNYLGDIDFYRQEKDLNPYEIETNTGGKISKKGYFEIKTDNKYLFFNRTKNGFLARDWDDDAEIVLTGYKRSTKGNLFLTAHRGKDGLTARDIEIEFENEGDSSEYTIENDTFGNSFALRVKEDGSVGYSYLVKDCNSEKGYSILSEYSYPMIIKKDEWNVINVKIESLNGYTDDCGNSYGIRKIRISIYVNGRLKLVSKELPDFNFMELDESSDKQEGVPFNISLGGGTQGLCDMISLDYKQTFEKILPIEENFAGSFIGDMRSFKFYNCKMSYAQIMSNYLFEINKNN